MNRKIKIAGFILIALAGYFGLQYASSAVHYNCWIIKDDCVPPINLTSELIYRTMVRPPWLDQFEVKPVSFPMKDGRFGFWEGDVDGETVVIRVREDESPVLQWIERKLPLGIPIRPASGEHIRQWLEQNPEFGWNS